jgi:hypothetical protein
MATINPTFTIIDGRRFNITWAAMGPGDDGAPVEVSGATWRSIQAVGGIGSDSVLAQGSNDGIHFSTVTPGNVNPSGPIDIPSRSRFLRPLASASNSAALDVTLHCAN